jgi:outer membrane protein assembly factor BamD (BamD/ComL family)
MLKRFFALAVTVAFVATAAFAAGEWEWTAGQGWVRGAGVARPTPKEQLHYAYELEQRGEFMDAARQYFLLVQNFPDSEEAGVGLQRLARCLFEMENYYTSYRAIEQVIETYPNTGRMSDLVEIELRIAKRMMTSQTPDLLSDGDNPRDHNIRRAIEIVDAVIEHDPYGPVAAEAYLVKGEGHLFRNEVNAARTAFETIRDEFPRSDFVERARLGILTCDSLVGQASPGEVQAQAEVVRELEREYAQTGRRGGPGGEDELDSVEESIRKLAEVEAAKMLEQAEQYRIMGTREAVQSSQFLYGEIARRYPDTPQAEEALNRLDNLRVPREENRIARVVRNINLNPFSYNRDPEPPWIVPQMRADDQVMVDPGLGPIAGVPETGSELPGSRTG